MAFDAIAGDHHQRVRDHSVYYILPIVENHNPVRRAGIMQVVETLPGEALARLWKQLSEIQDE